MPGSECACLHVKSVKEQVECWAVHACAERDDGDVQVLIMGGR